MPKFSYASVNPPLLPAQARSSLRPGKHRAQTLWRELSLQLARLVLIAVVLFIVLLYFLGVWQRQEIASRNESSWIFQSESLRPRRNEALKRRLDALIEEATQVAREKGIMTDVDAVELDRLRSSQRMKDWSWLLERPKEIQDIDSPLSCTVEDCAPHGLCGDECCRCVVAFAGKHCGHSVLLSDPDVLPSLAKVGYEGDFIQTKASPLENDHDVKDERVFRLIARTPEDIFKGKFIESCAVVGTSGSLLLRNYGESIDRHSHVFRTAPPGLEKFESPAGTKPGLLVLVDTPEGMKWIMARETILATPAAAVNLQLTPERQSLYIVHPNFTRHLVDNFASPWYPSALLYALALAMNTCHSVTVFGAGPVPHMPAVPPTYYDPCASSVGSALANDWPVVSLLVRTGLITYGEPCVLDCGTDGNKDSCAGCQQRHGLIEGELSLPNCHSGTI